MIPLYNTPNKNEKQKITITYCKQPKQILTNAIAISNLCSKTAKFSNESEDNLNFNMKYNQDIPIAEKDYKNTDQNIFLVSWQVPENLKPLIVNYIISYKKIDVSGVSLKLFNNFN